MNKYKAIIYDIDGTLLDTARMNLIPLLQIIEEELHETWTYEEVTKFLSYPGLKTMELLGIKNIEEVYARWVAYVNAFEEKASIYPGVIDVLEHYHGTVVQAIVSSKKRDQYEIDFLDQGLGKYIEVAVLAEDTKLHKPDPAPMEKCIAELGLQKEEVIYIGDAYSDYMCCKNTGIDFALASWGAVSLAGMEDSTYILQTPLDMLKLK